MFGLLVKGNRLNCDLSLVRLPLYPVGNGCRTLNHSFMCPAVQVSEMCEHILMRVTKVRFMSSLFNIASAVSKKKI